MLLIPDTKHIQSTLFVRISNTSETDVKLSIKNAMLA
jgi:hypothetical protein